jgi:hypothetical protein
VIHDGVPVIPGPEGRELTAHRLHPTFKPSTHVAHRLALGRVAGRRGGGGEGGAGVADAAVGFVDELGSPVSR